MTLGLKAYDTTFPEADVVLLEPPREDHEQFFSNIFSFNSRRTICEHAYRSTRLSLRQRADEIGPVLERHGLALNHDFLASEHSVWSSVGLPELDPKKPKTAARWDTAATGDLDKLLLRVEKLVERQRLSAA